MNGTIVDSVEELQARYGEASRGSLMKELDHLSAHYRAFVEASPFVLLATAGPEGLDCSPRGDGAGFVRVENERLLLIPDRPGNNRLDTLKNIVRDGRIGLLFLVPGIGETLRVNGRAQIDVDDGLCASFAIGGKPARSVIRVAVDRAYFQCQKALARSKLWNPASQIERSSLPSAGQMLAAVDRDMDAAAYDAAYPERMKLTLY